MNNGDCVYIFSDGFADQFGGEVEKKLTKKRFRELILSINSRSMQEQGIVGFGRSSSAILRIYSSISTCKGAGIHFISLSGIIRVCLLSVE